MMRLCLPICNAINKDLEFTAETSAGRLPTLDFEIWLEPDGEINHSYYQKPMKAPFVIMKRSAIAQTQKIQILSNELVRRLSNVNHVRVPKEEIVRIIEIFTTEMKTSEYDRKETKEVITSGMKGWQRKILRREGEGNFYRPARSTLSQRCKKKLLEKTSWYKKKRKREDNESEEMEPNKRSGKIYREAKRRGGSRSKS